MAETRNIRNEIWAQIPGYSLYEVSNLGRIRSHTRKARILKTRISSGTVLVSMVNDEGKRGHKSVSRLVANAFIPNPKLLPLVLHINGDAKDNRVENLEYGDNQKRVEKIRKGIVVCQYDKEGTLIDIFRTATEASKKSGADISSILLCCKGKMKQSKGYIWKYGRNQESTAPFTGVE